MAIYNIRDYDQKTITDISGTIVDSGGIGGNYNADTIVYSGDYSNDENFCVLLNVSGANAYRYSLDDFYSADANDILRFYHVVTSGSGPVLLSAGVPSNSNGWYFVSYSTPGQAGTNAQVQQDSRFIQYRVDEIPSGSTYLAYAASAASYSSNGQVEEFENQLNSKMVLVTWYSNSITVGKGFTLSYRSNLVQNEIFSNQDDLRTVYADTYTLSKASALLGDSVSMLNDGGYLTYAVSSSYANPLIKIWSDDVNNRSVNWPRALVAAISGNYFTSSYEWARDYTSWEPRVSGNSLRVEVSDASNPKKKLLRRNTGLNPTLFTGAANLNYVYNGVAQNDSNSVRRYATEYDNATQYNSTSGSVYAPRAVLGFKVFPNASSAVTPGYVMNKYSPNMYSFRVFNATYSGLQQLLFKIHELRLGANDTLSVYRYVSTSSFSATAYDEVRNQTFNGWTLMDSFSGSFSSSKSASREINKVYDAYENLGRANVYYAISLKSAVETDGDGFLATLKPYKMNATYSSTYASGAYTYPSFSLSRTTTNKKYTLAFSNYTSYYGITKDYFETQFLVSQNGNLGNAYWATGSGCVYTTSDNLDTKYFVQDSSTTLPFTSGLFLHGIREKCLLTDNVNTYNFNNQPFIYNNSSMGYFTSFSPLASSSIYLDAFDMLVDKVGYQDGFLTLDYSSSHPTQYFMVESVNSNTTTTMITTSGAGVNYISGEYATASGSYPTFRNTIVTGSAIGTGKLSIYGGDLVNYFNYAGHSQPNPYYLKIRHYIPQSSASRAAFDHAQTITLKNSAGTDYSVQHKGKLQKITYSSDLYLANYNGNRILTQNEYNTKYFYISDTNLGTTGSYQPNEANFFRIRPSHSPIYNDIFVSLGRLETKATDVLRIYSGTSENMGSLYKKGPNAIYNLFEASSFWGRHGPSAVNSNNSSNYQIQYSGIGSIGKIRTMSLSGSKLLIGLRGYDSALLQSNSSTYKALIYDTATTDWTEPFVTLDANTKNINCFLVSGSFVYVGGDFTSYGGNSNCVSLVKANPNLSLNQRLGAGYGLRNSTYVGKNNLSSVGSIYDLHLSGADVYIAGAIDGAYTSTNASWQTINNIVRYNPTANTFYSLNGTGLTSGSQPGLNGAVYTIARSGSTFFVGGDFTSGSANRETWNVNLGKIASYTSASGWARIASGTNGAVNKIVLSGNNLYVGGDFTAVYSTTNAAISASRIALFNLSTNTWSALGNSTGNGVNGTVNDITVDGTDIYLVGAFTNAASGSSSYTIRGMARWNNVNNSWNSLTDTVGTSNVTLATNTYASLAAIDSGSDYTANSIIKSGSGVWVAGGFKAITDKLGNPQVVNYITYNASTDSPNLTALNAGSTTPGFTLLDSFSGSISSPISRSYKNQGNIFVTWKSDASATTYKGFDLAVRVIEPIIKRFTNTNSYPTKNANDYTASYMAQTSMHTEVEANSNGAGYNGNYIKIPGSANSYSSNVNTYMIKYAVSSSKDLVNWSNGVTSSNAVNYVYGGFTSSFPVGFSFIENIPDMPNGTTYYRYRYLDPVWNVWSQDNAAAPLTNINATAATLTHTPTFTVISASDSSLTVNIVDTRATSSAVYGIVYGSYVTSSRPVSTTTFVSASQLSGTTYTINNLDDATNYGINGTVSVPALNWGGGQTSIFGSVTNPKYGSYVLTASQVSNLLTGTLYDDGGKNDYHTLESSKYFIINPSGWVNTIKLNIDEFSASIASTSTSSMKIYTRTDSLNSSTPSLTNGWTKLMNKASTYSTISDYKFIGNYIYLASQNGGFNMYNNSASVAGTAYFARYNVLTDKIEAPGLSLDNYSYTMAQSGNYLFVGGAFTTLNNIASSYLFRYDLTNNTSKTYGTRLNGSIYKMILSGNDLYAVGAFTQATNIANTGSSFNAVGAFSASYIAKFNTITETWSQLSSAVGGEGIASSAVYNIRYNDNKLYLAQSVGAKGAITVNGIPVWDITNNTWTNISGTNGIGSPGGIGDILFSGSDIYVQGGGVSGYSKFSGSNNTWYYSIGSSGGIGGNDAVIYNGKMYIDNQKIYDIVSGTYVGTFASALKAGTTSYSAGGNSYVGLLLNGNTLYQRQSTSQNIDFVNTASYTNQYSYSPLAYINLDNDPFVVSGTQYKLLAEITGSLVNSSSYTFTASNLVLDWYASPVATRQKGFKINWSGSTVVPTSITGSALVLTSVSSSTAIKSGSLLDPGATFVGYPVNDTKSFVIQPTRKIGTKAVNNIKLKLNKLNIRDNDYLRIYKAKDSSYLTASLPLATDGTLTGSNFVLLKTIVSGSTEFTNTTSITGSDHVVITWRAS